MSAKDYNTATLYQGKSTETKPISLRENKKEIELIDSRCE